MNLSHPLVQTFDAVAFRGQPSSAELDELVADLTRFDDCKVDPPELRRQIKATIDQIISFRDEGSAGEARRTAREGAERLAHALGPYTPPDPNAGKSMQEIVDSIPRGMSR